MKLTAENTAKLCFVCNIPLENENYSVNPKVMLPVCLVCNGTDQEKEKENELLDSLSDGLFCGCI